MTVPITIPKTPLFETLIERLANKDGFERIPVICPDDLTFAVHKDQYCKNFPDHQINLGSYSFSDMTTHQKFQLQWPYTQTEIAREYILYCAESADYKLKKHKKSEANNIDPLYFTGFSNGLYSYIDIRACYFQLYRYLGLDICYFDSDVSSPTVPFLHTNELEKSKKVRNSVWGTFQKRTQDIWSNGNYDIRNITTNLHRPDIVAYILDTMQAIIQDAINNFQVFMWLTDAAILPASQSNDFQQFLKEEWLLDSVIQSVGPGTLYSLNCYKVGDKLTQQLLNHRSPQRGNPWMRLKSVNITQLKDARKWLYKLGSIENFETEYSYPLDHLKVSLN